MQRWRNQSVVVLEACWRSQGSWKEVVVGTSRRRMEDGVDVFFNIWCSSTATKQPVEILLRDQSKG